MEDLRDGVFATTERLVYVPESSQILYYID
jgi:hypothetical protein